MADNVTFQTTAATPASGTVVACDEVTYSGDTAKLQVTRQVAITGSEGSKTVVELYGTRSDTFTATDDEGTAIDAATRPMRFFALQVTGTDDTPTSWTVVLEGSLDGTTYTTLITHDTTTHDDGATAWGDAVATPVLYLRSRCVELTLGSATDVVAVILGVP